MNGNKLGIMTSRCQSNIFFSQLLIAVAFRLSPFHVMGAVFKSRCSCEEGRDSILGRFRGPARGRASRRANAEDLDSLAALAAQTLPYMATPCSGSDPLTPCFNYRGESNIAGMLRTASLLREAEREGDRQTEEERKREGWRKRGRGRTIRRDDETKRGREWERRRK